MNPESAHRVLQDRYEAVLGSGGDRLAALLALDPGYVEDFVALAEEAAAGPLPARARALILLACDAAVTYRNQDALRLRIESALDLGVSVEGVLEVLELVSVLGIHAVNAGLPIVLAEYADDLRGVAGDGGTPGERQLIRERFERMRGYWDRGWDDVLEHLPRFFDRYVDFSAAAGRQGVLEPKTRELVLIAIDAATTHLFTPGTRIHVRNARACGASLDEVLQVLQLVALIGIESALDGSSMLVDRQGREHPGALTRSVAAAPERRR